MIWGKLHRGLNTLGEVAKNILAIGALVAGSWAGIVLL